MATDRLAREREEHASRLRRALDEAGRKQTDVARQLSVSPQFVNDILGRRKRMTRSFAAYFQSEFHVSSDWLLNGIGAMWHVAPAEATEREKSTPVPLMVELPRSFDEIGSDPRQAKVRLVTDIAQPATPDRKRFVYIATDDSMTPTIMKGDRLLFEAGRKPKLQDLDGKICALIVGAEDVIRRVELEEHDYRPIVHLISPNPDVPRRKVTRRAQEKLVIAGVLAGLVWRAADSMTRS